MSDSIILEAFWRAAQRGVTRRLRQLSSSAPVKSLRSGR